MAKHSSGDGFSWDQCQGCVSGSYLRARAYCDLGLVGQTPQVGVLAQRCFFLMPTCGDCGAGPRVQPPPVPSDGVRSYNCNRHNVIVPLNVRPEKDSMRVPLGLIYR